MYWITDTYFVKNLFCNLFFSVKVEKLFIFIWEIKKKNIIIVRMMKL